MPFGLKVNFIAKYFRTPLSAARVQAVAEIRKRVIDMTLREIKAKLTPGIQKHIADIDPEAAGADEKHDELQQTKQAINALQSEVKRLVEALNEARQRSGDNQLVVDLRKAVQIVNELLESKQAILAIKPRHKYNQSQIKKLYRVCYQLHKNFEIDVAFRLQPLKNDCDSLNQRVDDFITRKNTEGYWKSDHARALVAEIHTKVRELEQLRNTVGEEAFNLSRLCCSAISDATRWEALSTIRYCAKQDIQNLENIGWRAYGLEQLLQSRVIGDEVSQTADTTGDLDVEYGESEPSANRGQRAR